MDFRILGPMEVVDDGRPVAIRRGKEQALLAYLLLHPNQVVPRERLIDELWGERPPPTAAKILQNAVSHLRKQLGEGRLLTREPGYQLQLDPDELDANRFQHLAQQGQPHQALALWRGTPLVELQDERFADDARRQLDDHHANTLEDRIDNDLQNGKTSELIPELEHLTNQHPLRERLHAQLMLALYRSGRQADALEAYQHARTTLQTQLGLQPNPNLQHLQQQILNHDPTLTTPTPPSKPPTHPPHRTHRRRTRVAVAIALAVLAAAAVGVFHGTRGSGHALTIVPNSVVEIDAKTNRVTDVMRVGRGPVAVAVVGSNLWVANAFEDTLTHIDTRTGHSRTLGAFVFPRSLIRQGENIWVGSNSSGTLVAIDGVTGAVVQRIRVKGARAASSLAFGADSLWLSDEEASVFRVGLSTDHATTRLPEQAAHDIAFGDEAAWVALRGPGQVLRVDARSGALQRIKVCSLPTGLAVGFGSVWVGCGIDSAVWRIDTRRGGVTDVVHVGADPGSVAIGAGSVWVANEYGRTVSRIDPRTDKVVATVRTRYFPFSLAADGDRVWVTVSASLD